MFIATDQTAFVAGRQMSENIIKVMDVLHYTKTMGGGLPGAMVAVDAEGAYDKVDRQLVLHLLDVLCGEEIFVADGARTQRRGAPRTQVGEEEGPTPRPLRLVARSGFALWVLVLYTDNVRQIVINGVLSAMFPLWAGLPQGDPLSPSMYVVFAESLGVWFMLSLQGIRVPGGTGRLVSMRFADDIVATLQRHELSLFFDILDVWCSGTGARVNASKTLGMWIGALREKREAWGDLPDARAAGTSYTLEEALHHRNWRHDHGPVERGVHVGVHVAIPRHAPPRTTSLV